MRDPGTKGAGKNKNNKKKEERRTVRDPEAAVNRRTESRQRKQKNPNLITESRSRSDSEQTH